MAIEVVGTGYVGLGFASGNTMFDTDCVLGWISSGGQATIGAWNIPPGDYYYISQSNVVSPSWATTMAVVQGTRASDGATVTTLCFSRPLVAPAARTSANLQVNVPVNVAYAAQVGVVERSLSYMDGCLRRGASQGGTNGRIILIRPSPGS